MVQPHTCTVTLCTCQQGVCILQRYIFCEAIDSVHLLHGLRSEAKKACGIINIKGTVARDIWSLLFGKSIPSGALTSRQKPYRYFRIHEDVRIRTCISGVGDSTDNIRFKGQFNEIFYSPFFSLNNLSWFQ
jgi:hypothetical protein